MSESRMAARRRRPPDRPVYSGRNADAESPYTNPYYAPSAAMPPTAVPFRVAAPADIPSAGPARFAPAYGGDDALRDAERPYGMPQDAANLPAVIPPEYAGDTPPDAAADEKREFLELELEMRRMRKRLRRKYALTIAVLFMFAILLTFRYSLVIEVNTGIVREKARLVALENENSKLVKQISVETDLEKVRLLAESRLGMQKPDRSQIVYIRVPKKDHALITAAAEDADGESQSPVAYLLEQAELIKKKLFVD